MIDAITALAWTGVSGLGPIHTFPVQLAMAYFLLAVYLGGFLARQVHWSVGAAYFYFALISIRPLVFPQAAFKGFQIEEVVGFEALVTHALLYMTLIVVSFSVMSKRFLNSVERFLVYTALINAFVLNYKYIRGEIPYFLFNNPALDVSFIACALPLIFRFKEKFINNPWFSILLLSNAILPCIYTKTASGILGLGLSVALYLWSAKGFKLRYLQIGAVFAGVVAVLGWFLQGDDLVQSSGRVGVWKLVMGYWWKDSNIWIGNGAGTFQMYGPALQISNALLQGQTDGLISGFFWMHNDPLQILFETGILGFMFSGLVVTVALWRSRTQPYLFSGIVTYVALSVIQMPLRHVLLTFLGAFLLIRAFREKTTTRIEGTLS